MKKIALVTDSTADLSPQLLKDWNIYVMPLKIIFGNRQFIDGELTSEDFYRRLAEAETLPKTSQPAPEEFVSLYERILEKYDEIVSIHISAGLSGTLNAAHVAMERFRDRIHLVNSRSISLGIGQLVLEAAQGIREGLGASAIVTRIGKMRENIETIFTLDTLEYLHKGGRIGRVEGFLGSLLNIKPVIRVNEEGVYVPVCKTRSREKALEAIVKTLEQAAQGRRVKALAVAHGQAQNAAQLLQAKLEDIFQVKTSLYSQVGPVIGVHTGPGTVGASVVFD
jgi:DegV family protein with EDD domain